MGKVLLSGEVRPILTIDIVNYSMRSQHEQLALFKALVEIVRKALPEQARHPANRLWSPSGDGGSLTFFDTPFDAALITAIMISKYIKEYNKGEFYDENKELLPKPTEPLEIRTGIHSGPVTKGIDFDERQNVWGNGINISARVMSMAKPNQIVISESYYEDASLSRDAEHPGIEIIRIGKWWAKHNLPIFLYNVYAETDNAGISVHEVDEWFGPLHYPLENAIRIYEGMLDGEKKDAKYPFRVAAIAKRILDVEPQHSGAKAALESLSKKRFPSHGPTLYHPLFSDFSPTTISYFFEKSNFRVYNEGETIMTEGEKANSMMMIVSGKIELLKSGNAVYTFPEGDLIGEMGLFEENGKRSATLIASKRSMVLEIDYDSIRTVSGSPNSRENVMRQEIQRGIWISYTRRTIENKLNYHDLFSSLNNIARDKLKDSAYLIPSDYQTPAELSIDDAWKNLVLVINGKIRVFQKKEETPQLIEYGTDDILGTIRLVSENNPYNQIDVPVGTQFICFPWEEIHSLRHEYDKFDIELLRLGSKERQQRGLE